MTLHGQAFSLQSSVFSLKTPEKAANAYPRRLVQCRRAFHVLKQNIYIAVRVKNWKPSRG